LSAPSTHHHQVLDPKCEAVWFAAAINRATAGIGHLRTIDVIPISPVISFTKRPHRLCHELRHDEHDEQRHAGCDGDDEDHAADIMKLSDLKTNGQLLAERLESEPELRAEWERTALARAVALELVRYRAQHGLSQRGLAERLGMKQPNVARLELGEINPKMETLMLLSSRLELEFKIDIRPETEPELVVAAA
jgi:DNA-binding XRE family transcriptional regulator